VHGEPARDNSKALEPNAATLETRFDAPIEDMALPSRSGEEFLTLSFSDF